MYYSLNKFQKDINKLVKKINKNYNSIYAIPRGGIALGIALSLKLNIPLIDKDEIKDHTLIIDDVIDSGKTRSKFLNNDFACIHIKKHTPKKYIPQYYLYTENDWIEYWWEKNESPLENSLIRILEYIGEDPTREGLIETPLRIKKAYDYLFAGYKKNPKDVMKTFDNDGYDQIVLLKDIELYSMCEHHMLPFTGKCHIAYIPDNRVVGISKLARLMEIYARRMQIQERLGEQITTALMDYLRPKGAACIIEAQHLCMKARGIEKQNSIMITSSLKGLFLSDVKAKDELMQLIRGK